MCGRGRAGGWVPAPPLPGKRGRACDAAISQRPAARDPQAPATPAGDAFNARAGRSPPPADAQGPARARVLRPLLRFPSREGARRSWARRVVSTRGGGSAGPRAPRLPQWPEAAPGSHLGGPRSRRPRQWPVRRILERRRHGLKKRHFEFWKTRLKGRLEHPAQRLGKQVPGTEKNPCLRSRSPLPAHVRVAAVQTLLLKATRAEPARAEGCFLTVPGPPCLLF